MKKCYSLIAIFAMYTALGFSQQLTQTVRGTVVDTDSKIPLIGAVVIILGTDPLIGTITDLNGNFRLEYIPIGRISIQLSYMGYESKTISNVVVNSGKETVLELDMQESVIKIDEVVVKPKRKNGEALNEMALISARSVSPEQTSRYSGSMNDPSRILSNFAGVTNTQDGSSDIIVRGNSPKYMQWRLDGVEITSPYHFNDQNTSFGGPSMLNNNLLTTSDFYTGAFSPEYGNVLSSVYDVKLKAGNNEKFESTFGFGLIGTDFTVEGPLKKGYGGSFLINYRYSTVSLITDIGLIDEEDGIFRFQDMAAKIVLPTNNIGTFSIFTMGGLSKLIAEDIKANMAQTPGDRAMNSDIVEDYDKDNYILNSGLNHILSINEKSYLKTTLSYSTSAMNDYIYESQIISENGIMADTSDRILNFNSNIIKSAYRAAITYSNKIDSRNKIQFGTKYTLLDYDHDQSMLKNDLKTRMALVDFDGNLVTIGNFISWKHRLNDNLTIVSGFHNMNVLLNHKSTIEPRIALNWKINKTNSIHAGYGNHSNMESIHNYYTKIELDDGSIVEPNKDLDLLKANHFVLGYQKRITKNVTAKVELYYQGLYNLPVENLDTSYFATINEGAEYRYVDLVNEGTGKNYGIEVTLERYFTNNYYYLINASIYDSKYKALDGIERNTQYNSNYLINILGGKEFENLGRNNNKTLAINAKVFIGGGRKIISLLRDTQGNLAVDPVNNKYWDYDNAYENKIDDVHHVTLSASYKINKPKATHELFMDLYNLTNFKPRITEYYNEDEPNSVDYLQPIVGFFPNIMYRVYF